jgi:diacylglycerol kinase family enzyme
MRFVAVLNREGGTLRSTDLDTFSSRMREILSDAGHTVVVHVVDGDQITEALDEAAAAQGVDAIIAGGGDGTISAAAGRLMGKERALAVLPAGTMNLFARGLAIPLELEQALQAFTDAEIKAVDMATANGRPFIHQFSIGMHAKMVRLRDKMRFASRLGKINASVRAAYATIRNPPGVNVVLRIGEAEEKGKVSGIGVTNNLFGEGHLPYADHPDGGVLGIYVTRSRKPGDMLSFAVNAARGRWNANPHVDVYQSQTMEIQLAARFTRLKCVIDGELTRLEPETRIEIRPKALNVLAPRIGVA